VIRVWARVVIGRLLKWGRDLKKDFSVDVAAVRVVSFFLLAHGEEGLKEGAGVAN